LNHKAKSVKKMYEFPEDGQQQRPKHLKSIN